MYAYDVENLNGKVRGALLPGAAHSKTGVLVLGGSSRRVDIPRARLFAQAGAHALALQWFGGTGQSPGICEIPLETFINALDLLTSRGCDRIIVVGTSKGAEAALLASTIDQRIKAVVAISPTSVVWSNIGEGVDGIAWPERSSCSFRGTPLDFIPSDLSWSDLLSFIFRGMSRQRRPSEQTRKNSSRTARRRADPCGRWRRRALAIRPFRSRDRSIATGARKVGDTHFRPRCWSPYTIPR